MGNIEKVQKIFKALEFDFDIDDFEHRLIAQKLVCLLQLKGLDLGYQIDIYVRGPYSPELTKDLYHLNNEKPEGGKEDIINSDDYELIKELKDIIGLDPIELEIASTYAFFLINRNMDHIESYNQLKKMIPFYSHKHILSGINKAKIFLSDLRKNHENDMKEEFKAWQNASIF